MPLIWTFGSMPELDHLSPTEKKQLVGRSVRRGMLLWLWLQSIGVGGFLGAMFSGVAFALIFGALGGPPQSWQLIIWAIGIPLGILLWFQMQMRRVRRELRKTMIEAAKGDRLPVCLECGYDTRGRQQDWCPECNAQLRVPSATSTHHPAP